LIPGEKEIGNGARLLSGKRGKTMSGGKKKDFQRKGGESWYYILALRQEEWRKVASWQ